MNAATIATVVLAVAAAGGFVAALVGWVYHRGGSDRATAAAMADNTLATRELTDELRDFKDHTISKLHDHDIRLTVLENRGNHP